MSRSIELSDEDYARLERAAELERITPAEWIARRIPNWPEGPGLNSTGEQAGSNGTSPAKPATMAERLAGRIGRLSGSGGLPSSDNVAQSFAEYLEAKQRAGHL